MRILFLKLFYKRIKISIVLLSFLFLNLFIPVGKSDDINTTVSIDPSSQSVSTDDSFIVNVSCNPIIPIKAFEFKLSFNASLLQVNSVVEGDIFEGYPTYFNSGIINNTAGSIINVYGLIIGQGNVTNPGTLVTISFTATSNIGLSNITLYDAGVTNETMYLPIIINNGNVTINYPYYPHIFSNEIPANNSLDVSIDTSFLMININDPEGDPFYWEINTLPFIGNNSGYNEYNGTKTCNISNMNYKTTYFWFVNCKDLNSGEWTNKTYLFETESNNINPPGGGGGGDIPPGGPGENNPPIKPSTPVGSIFIEKGVLHQYLSSTFDIDGDKIRYMFDWGDGLFSNWSEYLSSNATVFMNHSWDSISNFEIRVMAQDEKGLNSSWSDPLEIIVSEVNNSGEGPDLIIDVYNDLNISYKTFIFDASRSIIFNGAIVNYLWDFGDGYLGYGVKVAHTYSFSKEYTVTLTVTDSNGDTYSESITLNVSDESDKNIIKNGEKSFNFDVKSLIITLVSILIFTLIIIKYREKFQIKFLNHKINRIKKSRFHRK